MMMQLKFVSVCASVFVFLTYVSYANTKSIATASDDKNVTKRDTETREFYPDWVPFKNKQGAELGEFVQVEKKAKPKKRLAPPMNFVLKAVAEPENEDYYQGGQGESDGEEYYEKKEWSDANRPASDATGKLHINHTELSEIDGVVNILTKNDTAGHALSALINPSGDKGSKPSAEQAEAEIEKEITNDEKPSKLTKDDDTAEKPKRKIEESNKSAEAEEEDEEEKPDPPKDQISEQERKENEERKQQILSSVDELKARHALEAREIAEKVKEEAIFEEELERYKTNPRKNDGEYGDQVPEDKSNQSSNEEEKYVTEKYKPKPRRPKKSTTHKPRNSPTNSRKTTTHAPVRKTVETGKLSVFRNPRLYMNYDDSDTDDLKETTTKSPRKVYRISLKTDSTPTASETKETTKPEEDKGPAPAPYFPKKKRNKRKRKSKTTTREPVTDATASDTSASGNTVVAESAVPDTTATGTGISSPDTPITGADTATTGLDTAPQADTTAIATAEAATEDKTDTVPASTDHKKEKHKKHEDYERERGGNKEFHSEHKEEYGEHGKKAYQGEHKEEKKRKGHHDKEDHIGKYDDQGGYHKEHHDESNHYGGHHHEEHGKKHAKYEESGKHAKGHNTKGSHDIHKKEEYEKKVEFFEEEGDSGEEEKHGGYNQEKEHSSGGHFKKGNLKAGHEQKHKGDKGHFAKGGHGAGFKAHKAAVGHAGHGRHGHEKFQKEGGAAGKQWTYHHGHPAKNANLVLIDRRAGRYQYGPFFG